MKKLATIFLLGVSLIVLVGCGGKNSSTNKTDTSDNSQGKTEQTSKETSKNSTTNKGEEAKEVSPDDGSKTDSSTTAESKVSDDPQAPKSDNTIRDEKGSETSLGQARITLYEAGIDSSSIDDETIVAMWDSSKGNKEAYIQSVKEYLGK